MASNAHVSSTGYEVQVVGDFLPHLNCGICLLIMKNATHGCSKHVFCEGCILEHIESGIRTDGKIMCPGGCDKCIDSAKLEANEFVDRMVNTLSTKCSNHLCNWQGDLLDLVQVHQVNCEFVLQSCDNKGCSEQYLKKDLLQHDEVCLYKLMGCSYCHTDIIRINKENHDVECANKMMKCEYFDIGCKKEFCRRDMFLHEDTHQVQHTRLIYQQLLTSKNEVTILKQENTAIKQENVVMKQQNAAIKQEIVGIKQENVEIIQENIAIKEEIVGIKQENVEIIQENIAIKEENGALKKTLEVLNEEVTQLKLEMKTITTDFCQPGTASTAHHIQNISRYSQPLIQQTPQQRQATIQPMQQQNQMVAPVRPRSVHGHSLSSVSPSATMNTSANSMSSFEANIALFAKNLSMKSQLGSAYAVNLQQLHVSPLLNSQYTHGLQLHQQQQQGQQQGQRNPVNHALNATLQSRTATGLGPIQRPTQIAHQMAQSKQPFVSTGSSASSGDGDFRKSQQQKMLEDMW